MGWCEIYSTGKKKPIETSAVVEHLHSGKGRKLRRWNISRRVASCYTRGLPDLWLDPVVQNLTRGGGGGVTQHEAWCCCRCCCYCLTLRLFVKRGGIFKRTGLVFFFSFFFEDLTHNPARFGFKKTGGETLMDASSVRYSICLAAVWELINVEWRSAWNCTEQHEVLAPRSAIFSTLSFTWRQLLFQKTENTRLIKLFFFSFFLSGFDLAE